jgi:hypothetical protein
MDRRTLALATALAYPEYAFAGGEAAVLEQSQTLIARAGQVTLSRLTCGTCSAVIQVSTNGSSSFWRTTSWFRRTCSGTSCAPTGRSRTAVARFPPPSMYVLPVMASPGTGVRLRGPWPAVPSAVPYLVMAVIGIPRPNSTSVTTSSPPGGSCTASRAAGTGWPGPATSPGHCTGRRFAPSMTGCCWRPGCRRPRANPWCTTPPA